MKNFNAIKRLLKEQNIEVNSVDELKNMCNANWYEIAQYLPIKKYPKDFELIGVYYNKSVNGLVYCDSGEITVGGLSKVAAINCRVILKQNASIVAYNSTIIAKDSSHIIRSNKSRLILCNSSSGMLDNGLAILKDNSHLYATKSNIVDLSIGYSHFSECYVKAYKSNSSLYSSTCIAKNCDIIANSSFVKGNNIGLKCNDCSVDIVGDSIVYAYTNNKINSNGGIIYSFLETNEIEGETNVIRMQ